MHWPDVSASKGSCHQALISISRTHLVEGKMATSEVYKDEYINANFKKREEEKVYDIVGIYHAR